ncbi:hypothetical protein, partial [Salmonella enterica]|uniref:hypothetical protein n=1 Tax=Salmonella enterica TaxID=28901 RepID=UPI001CB761BD
HLLSLTPISIFPGGHAPERCQSLRGRDHLGKSKLVLATTGDMAMITRQMSHRPQLGGVHEKS